MLFGTGIIYYIYYILEIFVFQIHILGAGEIEVLVVVKTRVR